ncbi:MAG: HAD-IA family hydrolase [Mycoplasmataceae bacterium]|nr:HAD-IA family hydrolase [Mycoplasmataceae bacterium]
MLKTIIFDIDGVITNLSFFHFITWKSIFSFHHINLTNEEWTPLVGLPRLTIAHQIAKNHHLHLSDSEIQHLATNKNELFVHLIKHTLEPNNVLNGIHQLIDEAIKKGLKLIVISTSANAVLEIQRLGLYDKFYYISNGVMKPSVDSETDALGSLLKKLAIKPEECIGLEDDVKGIKEYKKNGVYAVAIANYRDQIKQEADYWVDLPEQINLEEIIFSYYKNNADE